MTNKLIAILAGVIVLLGIGFVYFSESSSREDARPTTREFDLKVANKKLVEGPELLSARKGDLVIIRATADEAEELHLHGYDRSVDLEPGVEAELRLSANATGRFLIELEHSKTEIAALEVMP